jgi:hypothetical protein
MAETLQKAWWLRLVPGTPMIVMALLAGCTTPGAPPLQEYPGTVNVPDDWSYRNGGYFAPSRPAPAPPPPHNPWSFIPSAEAAPDPQPAPAPRYSAAPPLRQIPPADSGFVPADNSCGWYRLSNFWDCTKP